METLIGRKKEIAELHRLAQTGASEFVALYGRRRVGKTFLIRNVYQKEIVFQMTGIAGVDKAQQLSNFFSAFQAAATGNSNEPMPGDWFTAFGLLRAFLEKDKRDKKVVFFDELPWIDTFRSGFLSALEHFWNSWASARTDIVLVVCGSAASWMLSKLINNKGGLYNRVTQKIRLLPFTLQEVEAYFSMKNVVLDRYQIIQLYMALGGFLFI